MGRLRFLLYKISKLFPKNYRKPLIMISSILGLIIFFQIMTSFSGSIYLTSIQQSINDFQRFMLKEGNMGLIIIFILLLITWLSFRYYKQLQTMITICYVIVVLLAILPLVVNM